MEEFIKMKTTKIDELFGGVFNKEGLDVFMQFVELPDEEFDTVWPNFKANFKEMLDSEKFQRE